MRYTQALVNGYRIVLECMGATYRYHGGGRRLPFLCEQDTARRRPPPPPERNVEPDDVKPI
jgi:hypothetical protein